MADTAARDRLFYSIPKQDKKDETSQAKDNESILNYIRDNIIGNNKQFSGPFGLRQALYLDYTASGKSLAFIEDYIRDAVLPEYGNTHTTTSVTSLQTTLFRHEARDIVRNAVHASEHDAVIFVGSGCTGAIHKLIHSLNLSQAPIVFVGPYEHHSNLLPWTEVGAKVVRVKSTAEGLVDVGHLYELLKRWSGCGRQLIGCFSAASNVTGILTDIDAVTVALHKHGALAFWDYATAAPYVKLDMNPVSASEDQPYMYKDAVFLSCHKFVGGVQTPGVLIAKKKLFKNAVPDGCGGGSVFFVRRDKHRYLQEPELKEEGGTPAIVEAIRAGLVFQLKQAVTPEVIMQREEHMLRRACEAWRDVPGLVLLGKDAEATPRLPIFSFLVHHGGSGRFLHHNYVSSLLNDLLGIQARGGCACAGPYAMDLLGMEEETSRKFEELLAEDSRLDRTHLRRYREYSQREIIRPGFTRINLPYFISDEELEFVLEAVRLVATEGWKLLPEYMFNPETGEWRQRNFQVFKDRKWLGHISYSTGQMVYKVPAPVVKGPLPADFKDCLQKAKDLFAQASKTKYQLADHTLMFDEGSQPLRWFLLPSEAAACLRGNSTQHASQLPFCPPSLREQIGLPAFVEHYHDQDVDDVTEGFNDKHWKGVDDTRKDMINDTNCDNKETKFSKGMIKCLDQGFLKDGTDPDNPRTIDTNDSSASIGDGHKSDGNTLKGISKDSEHSVAKTDSDTMDTKTKDCDISQGKHTIDTTAASAPSRTEAKSDSHSLETNKPDKSDRGQLAVTGLLETSKPDTTSCPLVGSTSAPSRTETSKSDTTSCPLVCSRRVKCPDKEPMAGTCVLENRKRPAEEGDGVEDQKKRVKDEELKTGGGDEELKTRGGGEAGSEVKNGVTGTDIEVKGKKKRDNKWFSPPKTIFAPFLKAMEEFSMIEDGDKVLVCLSGGKDSLSLLHTMRQYQFYCRKQKLKFELGAVTVDPETSSYDPSPLKPYLASLGVPYFYESQCILEQASNLPYECASICSFCSRMKRGRIYACARREGYNVLALGQHLDDLCESFLMSIFHNGLLRTMKAHYKVEEGDLRVIRPLVYVREKDLRTFAEKNHLPVIAENCPGCFEAPKERHRVKQLLAAQEILFPRIFPSLMSAIRPIMAINRTQTKLADLLGQADKDQDDMEI